MQTRHHGRGGAESANISGMGSAVACDRGFIGTVTRQGNVGIRHALLVLDAHIRNGRIGVLEINRFGADQRTVVKARNGGISIPATRAGLHAHLAEIEGGKAEIVVKFHERQTGRSDVDGVCVLKILNGGFVNCIDENVNGGGVARHVEGGGIALHVDDLNIGVGMIIGPKARPASTYFGGIEGAAGAIESPCRVAVFGDVQYVPTGCAVGKIIDIARIG